jgi:hypothetical protein
MSQDYEVENGMEEKYDENENEILGGDFENVSPGEFFPNPAVDLVYQKEFLPDPEGTIEKFDEKITELTETDPTSEHFEAAQQQAAALTEVKEAFLEKMESDMEQKKEYDTIFAEWKKATGDRKLQLFSVLMRAKEGKPIRRNTEKTAKKIRQKEALKRARETGDWSYMLRKAGL